MDAVREGSDDVVVIAPPSMADQVTEAGHEFLAGGEPPETRIAPIRERLPVASPAEAAVLGNRELFAHLAADAMLPAMTDAVDRFRPDLVLRDPCEYASAVVAYRDRTRTATIAISLADVEWGSMLAASPVLEDYAPGLTRWLRTLPYLTRFPASLDPSPFAATVRYHSLASANSGRPIVRWPAGSGPLVYVSFGTVLGYMSHATGVFRAALDALDELPVRALLTVGRRFDPALLGLVPPNVRIEPWVDQADVLGQVGLVVCHGGSGTVLGALAAGVPLVVVPLFADQFANARRVADCGAGIVVVGTGTKEENQNPIGFDMAPRLANAISIVLADRASYRSAAVQVAEEISSSPLPADLLNRFLR
jgi:hypothetical protein